MPVAALAYLGPEPCRRRLDRRPAHRLGDHRRDVALHLEDIVDVVGEPLVRMPVSAEEPGGQARRRNMLGTRQERPGIAPEQRLATYGRGVQIGTVEGVPHRDGLVTARGVAGQSEGHPDCGGAAGCQQHLVESARRQQC